MTPLRLGTRGSHLATTQSRWVADRITDATGHQVELVTIRSLGDDLAGPLSQAPQPGVFVSALRDALLAGEVDVVVHSMKDLPAAPVAGITLAAVPEREDPHDVLVSHARCTLADLPPGSRVGTSSPRRASHLRHQRPDLTVVDLRGNVDTRIGRVRDGELDAAVLAAAGIRRIGRHDEIDEVLEQFVPAPAQGALAVEVRSDDSELIDQLSVLDDPVTRRRVLAERAVLEGLAATCTSAVAAFAQWTDDTDLLHLRAQVGSAARDGVVVTDLAAVVSDDRAAHDLGMTVARMLLAEGAHDLLSADGWPGAPEPAPTVWVTRPSTGARADVGGLRARGACVLEAPVLVVRTDPSAEASADALVEAVRESADLLALTSAAALRALTELVGEEALRAALAEGAERGLVVAAVGRGTARAARDLGVTDVVVPDVQDSEAMLAMLADREPGSAVLPRGNLAMRGLQEGLAAAGWRVLAEQVYVTEPIDPGTDPAIAGAVRAVRAGAVDSVVLRSPSGVRAVRDAFTTNGEWSLPVRVVTPRPSGHSPSEPPVGAVPDTCRIVVGGTTTAAALEREWPHHGGRVIIAAEPSPTGVADATLNPID